jgi:uncharacterized protein
MTAFGQSENPVAIVEKGSSATGVAAFTFGVISIFAFAPLLVPISLLLAIIGLFTRQYAWSIVAIIAAGIGFITSPILMGLLFIFGTGSRATLLAPLGTMLEKPNLPPQEEMLSSHGPDVVTTNSTQAAIDKYPNADRAAAIRQGSTLVAKPSFDCKQTRSWSERAVCNDTTIAKLDFQMATLYRTTRAKVSGSQRETLKNAQLAWLRERERCKGDVDAPRCLLRVYKTRIAELDVAVPSGKGPAGIDDIKAIDFRNYTYDLGTSWCAKEFGSSTVEVRNGEFGDFSNTGFSIDADRIVYGDVTGDGHDEAVVITYCGGMHPEEQAFVYGMKDGRAVVLTKLEPGSRAFGGIVQPHICQGCSKGISIHDGVINVERTHGKAACCPEYIEKRSYRWNGASLMQVGKGSRRPFTQASR